MRTSIQSIISCICVSLVMGALTIAHAEVPGSSAKGHFVLSGGLNFGEAQTTIWGDEPIATGSESGLTLEGSYNYSLGKSWSVEGGLMHWGIADVSGTGACMSAFYHMKNGTMLGAGIVPSGGRFVARQYFGKSNSKNSSRMFGQFSVNGFSGTSEEYDSVMWTSASIGLSF